MEKSSEEEPFEIDRRGSLLLFARVDNEVLFVNPEVHTPLQLKEGQPTPLGVFVESAVGNYSGVTSGKHLMQYIEGHHRSSVIGRVLFADKEGRVYRDIDLKGVGNMIHGGDGVMVLKPGGKHSLGGLYGLVDRDTAFPDYDISEQFLQAGIRTYRILGIIGLKELVVDGRRMNLKEAVKEKVIDEDFHPVLEVRAFGTKARIAEMEKVKYRAQVLEDAKSLVAKELGKENISDQEYIEWFARTLAENVALIHKNGWFHKYLNNHNITLDGRVVDLDSVRSLDSEGERTLDSTWAFTALEFLAFCVQRKNIDYNLNIGSILRKYRDSEYLLNIKRIYRETYDQIFPMEERGKYFKAVA